MLFRNLNIPAGLIHTAMYNRPNKKKILPVYSTYIYLFASPAKGRMPTFFNFVQAGPMTKYVVYFYYKRGHMPNFLNRV